MMNGFYHSLPKALDPNLEKKNVNGNHHLDVRSFLTINWTQRLFVLRPVRNV